MPGISPLRLLSSTNRKDASHISLEAGVAVPDNLLGLAADEFMNDLSNLLSRVGLLHRQTKAHDSKKCDKACSNQQLHSKRLIDPGSLLRGHIMSQANRLKSLDLDAHQEVVQQTDKCKSFRH
jgi:hypothetical protein